MNEPVPLDVLTAREQSGWINLVIDTQKGSGAKARCYRMNRICPCDSVSPYDFGSIPRTLADDGDALDIMISHNRAHGREFQPVGRGGPQHAAQILAAGEQRFRDTSAH